MIQTVMKKLSDAVVSVLQDDTPRWDVETAMRSENLPMTRARLNALLERSPSLPKETLS